MKSSLFGPVSAKPVKSFFVEMITRDIPLHDAILDLLDNCVDGIVRSIEDKTGPTPYKGFKAEIELTKNSFCIHDNCGGIPWDLHTYALRMGRDKSRPQDADGTVGVYGIGMKRAIFKIGRNCLISTRHEKEEYEIEITPQWMAAEENWDLEAKPAKKSMKVSGTTILIDTLNPGITDRFTDVGFIHELQDKISKHYAFILQKGFAVVLNGHTIIPSVPKLMFDDNPDPKLPNIRPFVFKATIDDVDVFLAVGFTRPLPSEGEIKQGIEDSRYSSDDAGWTIVCNDRVVLAMDKTEVTGWGNGAPQYHTQFIAISGIVEFSSKNPQKLPTTTTKRGLETSSRLYLQVKNKMCEGMRIFTDYTNKWKGRTDESKKQIDRAKAMTLPELKQATSKLEMNATRRTAVPGSQYKPELPVPHKLDTDKRRIAFTVETRDFKKVSNYLFKDENKPAADVGEKCFEIVLTEAQRS